MRKAIFLLLAIKDIDAFRATRAGFQSLCKKQLLSWAVINRHGLPSCVAVERERLQPEASVGLAVLVPFPVPEDEARPGAQVGGFTQVRVGCQKLKCKLQR